MPLCSVGYSVKEDNKGSVSRHSVCVCVEWWETEEKRTRGRMTKQRPKGGPSFLRQTTEPLCVVI